MLAIPELIYRFLHNRGRILDLIARGCCAQLQLRSGIKDVSVISKLMKSLNVVGVVFIRTLTLYGQRVARWTRRIEGRTSTVRRIEIVAGKEHK